MEMTDLIGPGSVVTNLRITSKKQALQELAKRAVKNAHGGEVVHVPLQNLR